MHTPTLISFGEVLWDLLPTGKVAGGAPMNVAFQAQNLGVRTKMISRVGDDDLGIALLDFLKEKKVATELIQVDYTFPTGTVKVTLDDKASPSYEIVQPAAWDFIHPDTKSRDAVKAVDAFVFGSLSCRNETSKKTLLQLLEVARIKVFDVNLRPPFYSRELLEELLPKADLVKMNDEELEIVCGWYVHDMGQPAQMEFIKNKFGLEGLIVTLGAEGSLFLNKDGLFTQKGFSVKVQDTIGSGDAFLAAFLSHWLTGAAPADCLSFAGAAGAWVATQKGATNALSHEIVEGVRSK